MKPRRALKVFGLSNLGNTCFFNSSLQCILACPTFIDNLSHVRDHPSCGRLMKNLHDLATQRDTSPRAVFKHLIKKNRMYGYYSQQDSHEAFVNLIDIVQREMKKLGRESFRLDFESYLVYQLHCFRCRLTELLFEDNTNLMLDIERNTRYHKDLKKQVIVRKVGDLVRGERRLVMDGSTIKDHKNVRLSGFDSRREELYEDLSMYSTSERNKNKKRTDLENMIDRFFDYDFYTFEEHEYQCEKCKKKSTSAYKKYYMYSHPSVLVLCVKKFEKSKSSWFSGWAKSSRDVTYPEYLDLGNHSLYPHASKPKNCGYRLIGAVNHSGGLGGGHYTCYVRKNERWFYISDSYCKEASLKSALRADAYLLFYEKL